MSTRVAKDTISQNGSIKAGDLRDLDTHGSTYLLNIRAALFRNDDTNPDVICAKANLLLNKLSVTKFDKLSDDFMKVGLESPELMKRGVEMIVLKAQMEEHFSFMYADLCRKMTDLWVSHDPNFEDADAAANANAAGENANSVRSVSDAGTPLSISREPSSTNIAGTNKEEKSTLGKRFRACLLTRCQDEFTVDRREALNLIRENKNLSAEDKEEKEILLKKRYTGHMRFIGELYIKDLVSGNLMHRCAFFSLCCRGRHIKRIVVCCVFSVHRKKRLLVFRG